MATDTMTFDEALAFEAGFEKARREFAGGLLVARVEIKNLLAERDNLSAIIHNQRLELARLNGHDGAGESALEQASEAAETIRELLDELMLTLQRAGSARWSALIPNNWNQPPHAHDSGGGA